MLQDYLHRFKLLVDTLMSHPQIRVTHVWIGPPASDEELSKLEAAWGRVPAGLAALYRQANGVQLRWIDAANPTYDPARDDTIRFQGPWPRIFEESGEQVGIVNLPTVDELADQETIGWRFDMEDDPLCGAIEFESFDESQDTALYFEDAPDDPWVGVASDYLADVPPSGERTLSQYLEHVLSTWASIHHRSTDGPKTVEGLLRERVPLDPTRLVGQRIIYLENSPGHTLMHGRVSSLVDIVAAPKSWEFAPTLAEVESDLGETVYVPLRALDPPDNGDGYERLRADPDALRSCLEGLIDPVFEALAPVAEMRHYLGTKDGPAIANHAWSYVALTAVLDPQDAARLLFGAAHRLYAHPSRHDARPVVWPTTRPRRPHRSTVFVSTLAVGLLNAAAVHMAHTAPPDLAAWLGRDTTVQLRETLAGIRARDPLRGYDPLTDNTKIPGFLANALRGGPTTFNTGATGHYRGGELGLADFRVVRG